MTAHPLRRDWPIYFFATAAALSLVVSIPATYAAMLLAHGWGWAFGAMIVFELGAVGLELMTLSIPAWRRRLLCGTVALLTLTTAANYAAGADHLARAAPDPTSTYGMVIAAGYGWVLALGLAALFPALLFAFLLGLTARVRALTAHATAARDASRVSSDLQAQLTAVQYELDMARAELAAVQPIALPEPQAVKALDAPLPDVVKLRDVDGLSFAQVGQRLGVSRQAAQQRYMVAKRQEEGG